ncbi:hypothetical protein P4H46_18850 [Paenibacillus glucanolyticus]|uniref:hypothetical protein n=1 Tax=Paenibacillus glucanolyticus TaxID=59843 RepID=UPI0030C8E8AE
MGGSLKQKLFKSRLTKIDYFIIVLAAIFFPLAIVLAAIRVLVTQRHNSCKGRNNRLFGWVLVLTFGVMEFLIMIGTMDDNDVDGLISSTIVLGIVILIPAIIMFVIANREDKKFSSLLQVYSNAIIRKRLVHIGQIAQDARVTPAHAARDITFMFEERMLPYGKIDNGMVSIPSLLNKSESPTQGEFVSRSGQRVQYTLGNDAAESVNFERTETQVGSVPKSVECPGCGARTVVTQLEKKECEYCGTMIVA